MKKLILVIILCAPSLTYAEERNMYGFKVETPNLDGLKVEVPVAEKGASLDPDLKEYIRESTETQKLINDRIRYENIQKPLDDALKSQAIANIGAR